MPIHAIENINNWRLKTNLKYASCDLLNFNVIYFEPILSIMKTIPAKNLLSFNEYKYLLKLLKTSRRFSTFIREDNRTEIRFGAGTSDSPDEEIIPNPDEVGSSLPGSPTYLNTAFDPANFLSTKAYGQAPSNTQLTITYRYGGGVDHNIISNSLILCRYRTYMCT